jgi:hypothetical protein
VLIGRGAVAAERLGGRLYVPVDVPRTAAGGAFEF